MKIMMRSLSCVLILALCLNLTMYSQADALMKPWSQLTVREKYNTIKWNDNSYSAGATKVDEKLINKKLGSTTAIGIDELDNFKKYSIKCDVYSIKSTSSNCVIAIKFQGYKGYYTFNSHSYIPATLGDLIKDLNLEENLKTNKIYHSYWKDGIVASGNYISMEYTLADSSIIWDMLLSNTSAKNMGDKYYKNTLMDISIDVKVTGEKNIALSVNEDGYLQTNILATGKAFYIGKKKVNEFIKYVKKYGNGKTLS